MLNILGFVGSFVVGADVLTVSGVVESKVGITGGANFVVSSIYSV